MYKKETAMSTDAVATKHCHRCNQEVYVAKFSNGRNVCNKCRNTRMEPHEKERPVVLSKLCNVCKQIKAVQCFEANRAICKPCRQQSKRASAAQTEVVIAGKPHNGAMIDHCRECDQVFSEETAHLFRYRTDTVSYSSQCMACFNKHNYSKQSRDRRREEDEPEFLRQSALLAQRRRDVQPEEGKRQKARNKTDVERKMSAMKSSAISRNIEWREEDEAAMSAKITGRCSYCGHTTEEEQSLHGLDRVINTRGYTDANTVSCCYICNMMKRTFSRVRLRQRIIDMYHQLPNWTPTDEEIELEQDQTAFGSVPTYVMRRPSNEERKRRIIHQPEAQGRALVFVNQYTQKVAARVNTLVEATNMLGWSKVSAHTYIRNPNQIWVQPHWIVRDARDDDEVDEEEHQRMMACISLKGPLYLVNEQSQERVLFDSIRDLSKAVNMTVSLIKKRIKQGPIDLSDTMPGFRITM